MPNRPPSLKRWLDSSDCDKCQNRRHLLVVQDGVERWVECECFKAIRLIARLKESGVSVEWIAADWRNYVSGAYENPLAERAKEKVREYISVVQKGKNPENVLVLQDDRLKKGPLLGAFIIRAAIESGHTARMLGLSQMKEEYFEKDSIKFLLHQKYLCLILGHEFRSTNSSDFVGNLVSRVFEERYADGKATFFISRYPLEDFPVHYGSDVQMLFSDERFDFVPVGNPEKVLPSEPDSDVFRK